MTLNKRKKNNVYFKIIFIYLFIYLIYLFIYLLFIN